MKIDSIESAIKRIESLGGKVYRRGEKQFLVFSHGNVKEGDRYSPKGLIALAQAYNQSPWQKHVKKHDSRRAKNKQKLKSGKLDDISKNHNKDEGREDKWGWD